MVKSRPADANDELTMSVPPVKNRRSQQIALQVRRPCDYNSARMGAGADPNLGCASVYECIGVCAVGETLVRVERG